MPIKHTYKPAISFSTRRSLDTDELMELHNELALLLGRLVPDSFDRSIDLNDRRAERVPLVGQINGAESVTVVEGDLGEVHM